MMTSLNGNIFRVTAHLCGLVNNRKAGDLRGYRAHYDVTVMICGKRPVAAFRPADSVCTMATVKELIRADKPCLLAPRPQLFFLQ